MKLNQLFLMAAFLLPVPAHAVDAEPEMIYEDSKPIALIGLSEVWRSGGASGCENHIGTFEVEEIAYDGVSEIVGGIRVKPVVSFWDKKSSTAPSLMRLNTDKLSNIERSWLPTLVDKGSKLLIAYNICGSGGFQYVRDIYRQDKLKW